MGAVLTTRLAELLVHSTCKAVVHAGSIQFAVDGGVLSEDVVELASCSCLGRCLRRERRATAMVMAAARAARPAIWPPRMCRSSGNCADRSVTGMGWAGWVAEGWGVTCGRTRPGLVAGSGRAGNDVAASTPGDPVPGGSVAGGKVGSGMVAPTPAGVEVPGVGLADVAVASGFGGRLTLTLACAATGDDA
ncbi:MAG TPA: hypothetical protein VNF75_09520, partial [Candidatus Dormibacteraeota bacterium]|nr:hypothetical protein [Candidatus Dormibacteraeota bacterium]